MHKNSRYGIIVGTGAQWRALPKRYEPWQTVYSRFRKWQETSICEKVFHMLSNMRIKKLSIDSTMTKAHIIVARLGNPVEFLLSPENNTDSTHALELLKKVDIVESNILGDKAYSTKTVRAYITENGTAYPIPPKSNTKACLGR